MIVATCLGRASSKAVLISRLAKFIVGRTRLPCFNRKRKEKRKKKGKDEKKEETRRKKEETCGNMWKKDEKG